MFVYFERERESKRAAEVQERERERESQADSTLSEESPIGGLNPQNHEMMT